MDTQFENEIRGIFDNYGFIGSNILHTVEFNGIVNSFTVSFKMSEICSIGICYHFKGKVIHKVTNEKVNGGGIEIYEFYSFLEKVIKCVELTSKDVTIAYQKHLQRP